jgi:hypothetical protein
MPADENEWEQWENAIAHIEDDPLQVIRTAAMFERYFDAAKSEAVKVARGSGLSWEEISAALGVAKQSAWQRYRQVERLVRTPQFEVANPEPPPRGR